MIVYRYRTRNISFCRTLLQRARSQMQVQLGVAWWYGHTAYPTLKIGNAGNFLSRWHVERFRVVGSKISTVLFTVFSRASMWGCNNRYRVPGADEIVMNWAECSRMHQLVDVVATSRLKAMVACLIQWDWTVRCLQTIYMKILRVSHWWNIFDSFLGLDKNETNSIRGASDRGIPLVWVSADGAVLYRCVFIRSRHSFSFIFANNCRHCPLVDETEWHMKTSNCRTGLPYRTNLTSRE